MTTKQSKTYMLDATVLLHDPFAMFNFEDNNVLIPAAIVLKSLSATASAPGPHAADARDAMRALVDFFCNNQRDIEHLLNDIENPDDFPVEVDDEEVVRIVATKKINTGGSISLANCKATDDILTIAACYGATLVTKNAETRLLAICRNIYVEDYLHDKTSDDDRSYTGRSIVYLPSNLIQTLKEKKSLSLPDDIVFYHSVIDPEDSSLEVERPRDPGYRLTLNEFLSVKNASVPNGGTVFARCDKPGHLVSLFYDKSRPYDVDPRNIGQHFAIEALMTPAEEAPLVILMGPAGTAKTFLSLACGLEQSYNNHKYNALLVTKPLSQLDDGIGFLPGNERAKITPELRPFFDNIDDLMPGVERHVNDDGELIGAAEELMDCGALVPQAFSFFRGRSIRNQFFVIDEAQNTTPTQLFTLLSRAGTGTKIVLCGDSGQIDIPTLDRYSNGLAYISKIMRGSPLCWQVTFKTSECERSPLAMDAIQRRDASNHKPI